MTDGVVARQLAAYNAGDVDAFVGCYAQDAVLRHGDGRVLATGRAELRALYAPMFARNPGLHAEVLQRIELGPWVVDEELLTSGARSLRALVAYRVEDGVIRGATVMDVPDEGDASTG